MTNRNKFLNFISPIVTLFQFFGIAPRIIPSKYKDIIHLVLQYLRIATVIIISFQNPEHLWVQHDLTNQVVLKILLLSYGVSVFETIVTRNRQLKIVEQLWRIDEIIEDKFCGDFDNYDGMRKRYTWFIWTVLLGSIAFKLLSCSFFYEQIPFVVFVIWSYAHFGLNMRLLQNTFYVDMVYERLCIIHKQLNKLNDCSEIQEQLNLTSDIYGRLWMMINDINFTFGWSLMAIIIECIVDLVNGANIVYSNCDTPECLNTIVGKFKFYIFGNVLSKSEKR